MPAHILAVANQKGGVAKTTTSINLAASFAMAGHPTLVVDLDPQANATLGLGFTPDRVKANLYRLFIGQAKLEDALHATEVEGLSLLPSDPELAGAEVELADDEHRHGILRRHLAALKDRFRFILLDCPPSLGLITVNALTAANTVLIPMQAEYYALQGLSHLLGTLAMVQQGLNPALRVEGAVFTMVDSRNTLNSQVMDEVRKMFRDHVFSTVVPRNVRLAEAPSHGRPIALYDPRSKGAEAYAALASEILRKHNLA